VTGAFGKLEKKKQGACCLNGILALLRNPELSMGQNFNCSYNSSENRRNYKKVLMENNLYNHLEEQFPDLKHLIRSIQLIEGNPDCFGKSNGICERQDCIWLEYCLKEK
jgi:hypothetical protein